MESVDLLIKGWYVVTMNEARDIIRDGAVGDAGQRDRRGRQGLDDLEAQLRGGSHRRRRPVRRHARVWSTPTSTSPASR